MSIELRYEVETRKLAAPFRISGYVFESTDLVVVTLSDGEHRGRGEAAGVYYLDDEAANIAATLDAKRDAIEGCESREALRHILPAGGARNAVDCAMWELEASRAGVPAWKLAGLDSVRPLVTTFTIGADEPATMADKARAFVGAKSIKIKLTGDLELDIARVAAIRAVRPDVWIGVDANQGFSIAELGPLAAAMVEQRVSLIEQPLARGKEADLTGYDGPIPLAADESALGLSDVAGLVGRFQVLNIKLDKCGGLTEALLMAEAARRLGLGVMVGNMTGTSLAMAPAFIVGQYCEVVDLDGPIFMAEDRTPSVDYADGTIWCPDEVWGSGHPVPR
ncbi:MAG TPA: dipeptide epimerase [Allosphingosinicella sp.]|jgi:L-alanine-DL-glutamate epimerase-like enolase superfamily enzyme